MKENIKVGNKWVYIKCSLCNKKKDFTKEAFNKKCGFLEPEYFAKTFICAGCLKKDKAKETKITVVEEPKLVDENDDDFFDKQ